MGVGWGRGTSPPPCWTRGGIGLWLGAGALTTLKFDRGSDKIRHPGHMDHQPRDKYEFDDTVYVRPSISSFLSLHHPPPPPPPPTFQVAPSSTNTRTPTSQASRSLTEPSRSLTASLCANPIKSSYMHTPSVTPCTLYIPGSWVQMFMAYPAARGSYVRCRFASCRATVYVRTYMA